MDIEAHYYTANAAEKAKGFGGVVSFARTENGRRVWLEGGLLYPTGVSGKREARKIAAERGAQCWNF